MIVVSAADARYYRCLCQLLWSLARHPQAIERVVVYDLGWTPTQVSSFERKFPSVARRPFDFAAYPPFVRQLSNYAWKAPIVAGLLEETRSNLLWLDSATIVLKELTAVEARIAASGSYVPYAGAGPTRQWTHPSAARYLGLTEAEMNARMRSPGVCGFSWQHPRIRSLVEEWRRLSSIPECIAPAGASRANHRYEQSILTCLLQRAEAAGLALTEDALDVSEAHPTPLFSVRNKVPVWVPGWADPAVWRAFRLRRCFNVASNRWPLRRFA